MFTPISLTKRFGALALWLVAGLFIVLNLPAAAKTEPSLIFWLRASNNDLFLALEQPAGGHYPRFSNAAQALNSAQPGAAVLILADQYPEQTTRLDPADFDLAIKKNLCLYLEYPAAVPGLDLSKPKPFREQGGLLCDDFDSPAQTPHSRRS